MITMVFDAILIFGSLFIVILIGCVVIAAGILLLMKLR